MNTNLSIQTVLGPEFIGRKAELELLRERVEDALRGRGSVVAVAGEAGAGKTRLINEVKREAAERGMVLLCGTGDPVHSGLAYGVFLGVLTDYVRSSSRSERSVLRETIEELAPYLRDAVFPRAGRRPEPPSADVNPELRQMLFLARLSRMLLESARRRPVMLCLEDLHWADSASLRLLQYLATKNAEAPLLIVCAYRPEEVRGGGTGGSPGDP